MRILGKRTTADMIVYSEDKSVEIVLEFWEDGRGKALSSWEARGGRKEGHSAAQHHWIPSQLWPSHSPAGDSRAEGKRGKGKIFV